MTALQIVLLCAIAIVGLMAVGFMIAFIVELARGNGENKQEEKTEEVKSVFEVNINTNEKTESVSQMLAELDKITEEENKTEEPKEETVEPVVEEVKEEEKEEPKEEVVEETQTVEENKDEQVVETVVEEADEEVKEEPKEEQKEEDKEENKSEVVIVPGSLTDYQTRLDKVIQNKNKIEKELEKLNKSILKYDRTIRRKERNQKMLDRRAGELTNLNLLMYSVTDIKNVDEEKKVKQEELTAHIAELKASIQDAEEYIESNKGKNAHDISVTKYLGQEKKRYEEEIAELETLIKAITDKQD